MGTLFRRCALARVDDFQVTISLSPATQARPKRLAARPTTPSILPQRVPQSRISAHQIDSCFGRRSCPAAPHPTVLWRYPCAATYLLNPFVIRSLDPSVRIPSLGLRLDPQKRQHAATRIRRRRWWHRRRWHRWRWHGRGRRWRYRGWWRFGRGRWHRRRWWYGRRWRFG